MGEFKCAVAAQATEPAAHQVDEESKIIYVGPIRNCTPDNFLSALPVVQLKEATPSTTMLDLVNSYETYSKAFGLSVTSLSYNNEKYLLDYRVFDVMKGPFCSLEK